jgi:hypothetical protein
MSTMAQLRHGMLLVLIAAAFSACVVPVGPDWIDPEDNYPPTIHSATPPVGTVLTHAPDSGEAMQVRVLLADQNTKDRLYVRFIVDYPPFDEAVSREVWSFTLPGGDQIERPEIAFAPNCASHPIASGFTSHRLLLAVSDRGFVVEPGQLDKIQDGYLVEAVWPFEMECP